MVQANNVIHGIAVMDDHGPLNCSLRSLLGRQTMMAVNQDKLAIWQSREIQLIVRPPKTSVHYRSKNRNMLLSGQPLMPVLPLIGGLIKDERRVRVGPPHKALTN